MPNDAPDDEDPQEPTPRRSMLYTPATRPDRVESALTMDDGPDLVVADLEDGIAPDEKDDARDEIADVILDLEENALAERMIRVNTIDSRWFLDDVEAAARARPAGIVAPKVESPGQLRSLDGRLREAENEHDVEEESIHVLAQLETARGIAAAHDIGEAAGTIPRIQGLVFGAEDYAASVGARRTGSNHEVAYARSRVVLAAALGGVDAIDQVHIDYEDLDGLAQESQRARELGYVGKQIIHPDQIGPVHEAFTPSQEEVDEAREILDAVEDADIMEGGVIGFQGRMIDRPVIEQAQRTVALAEQLGL